MDDCVEAYRVWLAAVKQMNTICEGDNPVEDKIAAARALLDAEKDILMEQLQ